MSVFAILNRASQQQFSLRMNNDAPPQDKSAKSAQNLVKNLNTTDAPLSEKEEEAAKSLVNDFTEVTQLNATLAQSVKDNQDAMRKEKIERIEQRIKQLKEMLRFATPEQAERLLKELKQVSKDFSSAAQGLNKDASNMGTGAPNAAVEAAANAFSSVIDNTLGSPPTLQLDPVTAPATVPVQDTAATAASGQVSGMAQKEELKAVIYAYADQQAIADKTHFEQRVEGMREEHEALRKIGQELKMLAKWLEALAEKDDEDTKDDLDEIKDALKTADENLNDPDLRQTLGLDLEGLIGSGSSGPVSVSSVSVETSVSIGVSNIVV